MNSHGEKSKMNRRDILKTGLAAGAVGLAPRLASAQAVTFAPAPKGWRSFALTTRVEPTSGANHAWIPLPTFEAADWQRPGQVAWTGNAKFAERIRDPKYGAEMLRVEWAADQQSPVIEVTAQVQTQNRSIVPGQGSAPALSDAERKLNLASTELLPTDGLVKQTAEEIVRGKKDDLAKARALYEWVVDNTFRNARLWLRRRRYRLMIDGQSQRQMCRPQRPVRRHGASIGLPARGARHSRGASQPAEALGAVGVVTKAQHSCQCGYAAAGRRSIPATCARSCSRSRRQFAMTIQGRAARKVFRLLGRQLGRLQCCP